MITSSNYDFYIEMVCNPRVRTVFNVNGQKSIRVFDAYLVRDIEGAANHYTFTVDNGETSVHEGLVLPLVGSIDWN